MEKGLLEKTGKPLKEWVEIVKKENFEKHGQIISFLKKEHGFTHGFANFVAHKSRESDAGSMEADDLIENQYKGKETLKPILETILEAVKDFGDDVKIAPKKNSVSLRRKRQFALVQPSTKTRVDLGLKLDDATLTERLENSGPFGTMCTNRVRLTTESEIDNELVDWLKTAYEQAG
jgi:predicted transport protein